jgi:hypothetical protein
VVFLQRPHPVLGAIAPADRSNTVASPLGGKAFFYLSPGRCGGPTRATVIGLLLQSLRKPVYPNNPETMEPMGDPFVIVVRFKLK